MEAVVPTYLRRFRANCEYTKLASGEKFRASME
jgi:hypothetical protein